MTPRNAPVAAFVLLFGGLVTILVATASTGNARNTGDLTAEEIYARYLERTADVVFLIEKRYTQTVDPLTNAVVGDETRQYGWDVRPAYPGQRPIFLTFPCNCLDEDYPIEIEMKGMTEVEGRRLIHLVITDPADDRGRSTPRSTVWQDLYLDPISFEPFEIVTHFDEYGDGSLGYRYTQLRTSISRVFSRQIPDDPRNIR
ncbi:MAG: hypothetical protein AB7P33_09700 [Dehalococcoidia bacterium]